MNNKKNNVKPPSRKGATLTEKHKKRIGDACKKPVIRYSLDGVYLDEWDSIKDALLHLKKNIKSTGISSCLRGKFKKAYGFVWKYKNESDK